MFAGSLEARAKSLCHDAKTVEEDAARLEADGLLAEAEVKLRAAHVLRLQAQELREVARERVQQCPGEAAGDGGDTMNQLRAVVASVVADQERRSFVGAEKITPLLLWEKVGNHANVKFMEYNAVPVHRTTTAAGFHWDHGDQNTLRERCFAHLKNIIKISNPDLEWVETAQEYPHLLMYYGLETLGLNFDMTTEFVVASHAAVKARQPQKSLHLMVDVRRQVSKSDLVAAHAKVLLANLLSPEERPMQVVTDLNDEWYSVLLDCNLICQRRFSARGDAVAFLQDLLADKVEGKIPIMVATRQKVAKRLLAPFLAA